MLKRIAVLVFLAFGFCWNGFSVEPIEVRAPSQELGPADITNQLATRAAGEAALLEQQNLYRELKTLQDAKSTQYSKIIRSLYGRHNKLSKSQRVHLDEFLKQARSFRNKDGSLSLRTTQRLLKADPSFSNLKGSSPELIRAISHEIKAFDQSGAREIKLLGKINELRAIAKIKPLNPEKPKVIKSISRPGPQVLKAEAVAQKQALVKELLSSGKFSSKAKIQAAVEAKDPAVSKLVKLQRRIDLYDRNIKAQPINKVRYQGYKAAQSVKETLLAMDIVQRGRSLASRLPGNATMLDAYKTRRVEIFRELQSEGKFKSWREVREVMKAGKSQDPRILELRSLDSKIQKVRYELLRQKLPSIENSKRFSNRWSEVNGRIQELKALKSHLKGQKVIDTEALRSVKLHQKRAYLQQAELRLQHELLATKKYPSVQAIHKAVSGEVSRDPRIRSLQKIQSSMDKLAPKITRSVSNRVGAVTRDYQKALANQSSWPQRAANTVKEAAGKGWNYTKGLAKNGAEWVKAKHSSGLEYTRQKTAKGWDTLKVKTSDGWEWTKNRSQDARGWARGKSDAGWKYVGEKTRSLKALGAAKAQEFKSGSIEKARAIYNDSLKKASNAKQAISKQVQDSSKALSRQAGALKNTISQKASQSADSLKSSLSAAKTNVKAGWEYTQGKTRGGIEYIKAKSVDGWQYTKVKAADGWKVTRMKTADGWEWAKNRTQSAKGFVHGKADAGWKYLGAKAEGVKALAQTKAVAAKNWSIEKAQQAYQSTKAGAGAVKETILGKSKASWEIVKTRGAKGMDTIKAKSTDGWQYTKQKAADGWKMAKVRTADGWEWTRGRTSDAMGWAKGKADAGWKYVGDKIQAGKSAAAAKGQSLKSSMGTQAKAASQKVMNGVDWLQGKSIQAFEVSKTYVGKAASSTVAAGKSAGKAFAARVHQGQVLAGHEWVKPAAPTSSKPALQTKNPTPMPSQKAPLFSRAPNLSTQAGAVAKPMIFQAAGAKTQPQPQPVQSKGTNAPGAKTTKGKGFLESEVVRNTLKPIKSTGEAIAKGMGDLKGKGIHEIYRKALNVGNQVTDKVIGGKADAETGRSGYEVRRDSVANALTKKITQINQDIAKHEASGGSAKKIAKLKTLRSSLESEYQKSQIGPQGLQFKAEISELTKQIQYLKKIGGDPKHIQSLETLKGQKVEALNKFKGDSKAVSRNYIRDGLQFAVISAATQGIMNIVDQVRQGDDVNIGDAFDFITTPQFVLGTSGAFAGGLLVQKGLTTGMGKIAMSAVQNMMPGFLKPVAMTLPYMLGAMVGSDLLTGTLGQRSVGEMMISGVGSSVGMMLGSAIFPPVGSLVGAVLGGMIADHLMGGAGSGDEVEAEVKMLYEPHWLEFSELAWTEEDASQMETAMEGHESDFVSYVTPVLDGLQSIEELEAAKGQAYESYTQAVETEGPDSQKAQNAYKLYEEISRRMDEFSRE